MEDRILEFSNILRRNGVRVSLSENMDALRALGLVGIEERALCQNALRAALVKRPVDIKTFDDLFEIYFLGLGASMRNSDLALMEETGLSPKAFQELLEQIRRLLNRRHEEFSPLARALLAGEMAQVERLLRAAGQEERLDRIREGLQIGIYVQRMAARLELEGLRQELERFMAMAREEGGDAETLEKILRYVDRRLQDLNRMIRNLVQQELKKNDYASDRERLDYLYQKSFAYYTEEEIRRMKEVVARLARRFKDRLSVRRKRASRGRLDAKETLRQNLQYGGVPFRIHFDQKKKEKPRLIILCDISDSVLNASRFMLQLVYSVQELYRKVRTFVFVSDIGEVTRLFEENEIHQAVDQALRGDVVDVFSHSNFGRALKLFYDEHLSVVDRKTTLVVLGDGRNNYHPSNEWVLRELQQRAKQLVWLNPESRLTWGIGDSEMPRYIPYCDVAAECRNIGQLYRLIDRMVL